MRTGAVSVSRVGVVPDVDAGAGAVPDAGADAGAAPDADAGAGAVPHADVASDADAGAALHADVASDAGIRVLAAVQAEASAAEGAMVVFVCLQVSMKSIIA